MNRAELWETQKGLTKQVFDLVTECSLTRTEVMQMTNQERTHWLQLQTAKMDEQNRKAEEEKAKAKRGARSSPRSIPRRR